MFPLSDKCQNIETLEVKIAEIDNTSLDVCMLHAVERVTGHEKWSGKKLQSLALI